jgi:hypothetical protein
MTEEELEKQTYLHVVPKSGWRYVKSFAALPTQAICQCMPLEFCEDLDNEHFLFYSEKISYYRQQGIALH